MPYFFVFPPLPPSPPRGGVRAPQARQAKSFLTVLLLAGAEHLYCTLPLLATGGRPCSPRPQVGTLPPTRGMVSPDSTAPLWLAAESTRLRATMSRPTPSQGCTRPGVLTNPFTKGASRGYRLTGRSPSAERCPRLS